MLTDAEKQAWLLIRRGICLSRADLSRSLGVSRPTASLIAEKLLNGKVIREAGPGKSLRGKAPTRLEPVPEALFSIGLDLGYGSRIDGVLLDNSGSIAEEAHADFDSASMDGIRRSGMKLIRTLSRRNKPSAIGLAMPGVTDPVRGTFLSSVNPLFSKYDLKALFHEWTGLPVSMDNRSRLAAFSEVFGGAADKSKNFILLSLGKSIGAAFWLNGALFAGSHFSAGEIRSLRLSCGWTLEEALSPEKIAGIPLERTIAHCAEGIRQLIEIMDVDLLILAGRFSDFDPVFPERLEKALAVKHPCRIRLSNFGRLSAARGVAIQAAEHRILSSGVS